MRKNINHFTEMANRVLRDWTASESVDNISCEAEVFFTRLIMKADDYGSFYSNPKLIRAALFPLKEYKDSHISKWVNECIDAKLLFAYTVDGKEYLRIANFGQRLRNMRNTFPQPADDPLTIRRESPPETKRNETESETETNANAAFSGEVTVWPSFDDFWDLYNKKQDKPKCIKKWEKIKQGAREKIMEHLELYVRSTPDIQYRKNPITYLNNESWNDEIIYNGTSKKKSTTADLASALAERMAKDAGMREP